MKFLSGPLLQTQSKEIKLTGEKTIVFGSKDSPEVDFHL